MKKIFRTIIVVCLLIFLFRAYVRLFNKPLGREVGSWFGPCPVCVNDSLTTGLHEQLNAIKTQLQILIEQFKIESGSVAEDMLFQTDSPTKVALYYFNQLADQKLPPEQQVNVNSILPVYRIFPPSRNILVDVINELLKGNLTEAEKQQGFVTEFPYPGFKFLGAKLTSDGTLILSFTEIPGFTSGGSARMLILSTIIEKTVLQFPQVKRVVFNPETLFQP